MQDEVTLGEGATLGVLACKADRHALADERRVGERLGVRPVDAALGADRYAAALELLDQLGMDSEALGDLQQLLVEAQQGLLVNSRLDLGRRRAIEFIFTRGLVRGAGLF